MMFTSTTIERTVMKTLCFLYKGMSSAVRMYIILAGIQPNKNVPKMRTAVTTVLRPRAEALGAAATVLFRTWKECSFDMFYEGRNGPLCLALTSLIFCNIRM